jgi:thiol-disulfide isomerase/thioredoxin
MTKNATRPATTRSRDATRRATRARRAMMTVAMTVAVAVMTRGARGDGDEGAKRGAIEMRADDLEDYLARAPIEVTIATKFYAPWCGHCKTLAPLWDDFARRGANENIIALSVDASGANAKALNAKFNVQGFPTLFFFKGGAAYEYSGKRAVDDLVDFARSPSKFALGRAYAVDDATNALVFAKPPFRVLLRDVSRGIARDYARVVGKHPQLLVAVFVLGVWLGACAVGAAFFFTGDYAAAKQWREFIARNADAIRAANAAADAADASNGKKTN